jgi:hypothetical protein
MPKVFKIGHRVGSPCPTTRATAVRLSAQAYAVLTAEEDSTVNYKLNCAAWDNPYAEVWSETDFEKLLTILAGSETAVFQCLGESAADRAASGLFCVQVAPRCSARSRSTQIGEHRVL